MNEYSERYYVCVRTGGHPDNWQFQQINGKREFHIHDARHLLKKARANALDPYVNDWIILDSGHLHEPEEWCGVPHHSVNQNSPRMPRPVHVTFLDEASVPADFKVKEQPEPEPKREVPATIQPLSLRERLARMFAKFKR